MTEEKKPQKNGIFYWLGGFIIIGLLALSGQYLYLKFVGGNSRTPVNHGSTNHDTKLASAIYDYGQWANSLSKKSMDLDHELTKTGLNKIANVLTLMNSNNLANQNNNAIHTDIDRIHGLADSITYNWKSGKHADMIKRAFSKTANVISALQLKKKPAFSIEIDALKNKIKDIDVNTLTLDQRDQVKDVFNQIASVFEKF